MNENRFQILYLPTGESLGEFPTEETARQWLEVKLSLRSSDKEAAKSLRVHYEVCPTLSDHGDALRKKLSGHACTETMSGAEVAR